MRKTGRLERHDAHAQREAFDDALAPCFAELLQAAKREVRHRLALGQFEPDHPTQEQLWHCSTPDAPSCRALHEKSEAARLAQVSSTARRTAGARTGIVPGVKPTKLRFVQAASLLNVFEACRYCVECCPPGRDAIDQPPLRHTEIAVRVVVRDKTVISPRFPDKASSR
jgi:hypothetical protein